MSDQHSAGMRHAPVLYSGSFFQKGLGQYSLNNFLPNIEVARAIRKRA